MATVEPRTRPRRALRGKRRRPVEDRFALRFPALATRINARLTRIVLRMPRRWRLRRLLIELGFSRFLNAVGRGATNREDLDVVRVGNHADVVWDLSRLGSTQAPLYYGRDGAVRFNEEWVEAWSDLNIDVDVEEVERGVFVNCLHLTGVGRTGGTVTEQDMFQVVRIRDGLVWRGALLRDLAQALEYAHTTLKPGTE